MKSVKQWLTALRNWLAQLSPWALVITYAVVVSLMAMLAQAHSPWLALAAAAFVAMAVMTRPALNAWRGAVGVGKVTRRMAALAIIGAVLLWLWPRTGQDAVGFLGVAALYFALGQAILAVRENGVGRPLRSLVLAGIGTLTFLTGLVVYTLESASWGLLLVGLTIVLTPLTIGLAAEDILHGTSCEGRRNWGYLGVILLLIGLIGPLSFGMPLIYALAMALVLLLLVGAIASKTEGDIISVLLVLLLVWATAPRDSNVQLDARQPGEAGFAALGDSFISGEGAESFFAGTNDKGKNECRRAPTAYAAELADPKRQGKAAELIPDRVEFIACSGAKAIQIWEEKQYPDEPGGERGSQHQLQQLAAAKDDLRFVLLSIGGNDAGFGEIGRACVLPGDCAEIGASWLEDLAHLPGKLDEAYTRLRATVRGVPVIVLPYPVALNARGCSSSILTADEHQFLEGFTRQLNKVVRQAADRHGFYYVEEFETALRTARIRICDTSPGKAGVNFLAANPVAGVVAQQMSPTNWFHNSLHPNKRGHDVLRKTLVQWFLDHPELQAEAPDDPKADGAVAAIEDLLDDEFDHCAKPEVDLASCRSSVRHWTASQLARIVWYGVVPVLFLVVGALFIWLRVMLWWRCRREGEGDPVTL